MIKHVDLHFKSPEGVINIIHFISPEMMCSRSSSGSNIVKEHFLVLAININLRIKSDILMIFLNI